MTGRWRPERPSGTGYFTAFLEFEDGTPVTVTYNGYGFFDSVELTTWGADKGGEGRVKFRKALLSKEVDEEAGKESTRFGTKGERVVVVGGREGRPWLPGNLGLFIVSFDDGDVRMSSKGLFVYGVDGVREIEVKQPGGEGMSLDTEVMELYNAVKHEQPLFHDGPWGMATAEVQWAILESARQRSEIFLKHQVPVPQGY
jgi:phthalate 4,5-cis-dihydrodiol dehydrogenase